jgi:hypothetical protein
MRRCVVALIVVLAGAIATAQDLRLPNKSGSIKFAVIGDTGTGDKHQVAVAKQIATFRSQFQFPFVIMVGDNIYGGSSAKDFEKKFEAPYKPLLDSGVKFYAALGNHDDPKERFYKPFNMNGERFYSFKPSLNANVRFFALDSNYMDDKQVQWLDKELAASGSDWKIAFFHHPPYSSGGTHGSATVLRDQLEPVFVKYGVNAVFTGHEHFYERIAPQKGVAYFISGSSAKLREGDIEKSPLTAAAFDEGYAFMLVEIDGDSLSYQTISDAGKTIDAGVVKKSPDTNRIVGTAGGGRRGNPAAAPTDTKKPIDTKK